jgi:PAS domain-containing protein
LEKQLWPSTLSSIGAAVIATDAGRRVAFLNAGAERLTGWAWAEALDRPLADVFRVMNEEIREAVPCPVGGVLGTGRVRVYQPHASRLPGRDRVPRRRLSRTDP